VHDALTVGVGDGGGDLLDDLDAFFERDVVGVQVRIELLALDVLHGVVQRRCGEVGLVERGEVGVPEARDQVDFVLEVRLAQGRLAEEHLHGFDACLAVVNGLVDVSEAPAPQLSQNGVAAEFRKAVGGELPKVRAAQLTLLEVLFDVALRCPGQFARGEGLDLRLVATRLSGSGGHPCTLSAARGTAQPSLDPA